MFKTFCAYLTICSLVTSQLYAPPPRTEKELTNMATASSARSSQSSETDSVGTDIPRVKTNENHFADMKSALGRIEGCIEPLPNMKSALTRIEHDLERGRRDHSNQHFYSSLCHGITIFVIITVTTMWYYVINSKLLTLQTKVDELTRQINNH